jgi:amino acid transporter/nucleotide-binding universal stress UspA family protein
MQVIVVGSVMLTFISFWRTAAVVLCDLASTAYYIGGIAEQAVGKSAPWYILAVMVFSYGVRNVYIESCSMFVRGGVYRVVRTAMGGFMGKLSVSALIFDYILTGPISSVSAGQYLVSLFIETLKYNGITVDDATREVLKPTGAVVFAIGVTLYFFWQNLKGIHESSDKAFKIMIATTVMAVVILVWCGVTLVVAGPRNSITLAPDLNPRMNYSLNEMQDPLGFLAGTSLADSLRSPNWLSLIGLIGIVMAFGHSILAMSGEETLAQVYREVEAPKLQNFRKAALVVFIYSLGLTSSISFLAVLLIPDDVRMKEYADNLIGGLSMHMVGPAWARLLLNAFVVGIGALILSGAVNTAIIGSNGVLNRVAEDGVLPNWLRKPHPKYGTSYRILYLILVLKIVTILASRGDVLLLGEAYAFGVVWSFVFMSISMVVLRFKHNQEREYRVPFNIRVKGQEIPFGLIFVFLVLFSAAVSNLMTKQVATVSGIAFTIAFLMMFSISEWVNARRHGKARVGAHPLEQFNVETADAINATSLGLEKEYRKLVAIRSTRNLFMLERSLAETDPDTTDVVVMTAKVLPEGDTEVLPQLDDYDQQLMTAVVDRAEKAGKQVRPIVVPTNNPLHAVLRTARDLKAQEVVLGASNKYATDVQLEQLEFFWIGLHGGETPPLSVRILGRDRDVYLDIAGGNRIPKLSERKARTVAELRAAGVGVSRVLMLHDGTASGSDLFRNVLTMLDPQVTLGLAYLPTGPEISPALKHDETQAQNLERDLTLVPFTGDMATSLIATAKTEGYQLIVVPATIPDAPADFREQIENLIRHSSCPVFVASMPAVPTGLSPD